jgi:nucleoprotein TPR
LQSEASQLASQLAQTLSDRDAQANFAQSTSQKLTKSVRENELLQKQLEDLGRQVQSLLREIGRRDDPTIPSDEDLDAVPVIPAEDTEAVITNNLVLFKSVGGLQEQNQKLLKIVRELGRKMENEEREYREVMEKEQDEAIKEAHEVIQDLSAQLERQKKSSDGVIQAYMKERDALRGMLARAGNAARVNGIGAHHELSGLPSDTAKELAEIQSQFEAYRMEMGIDTGRLREDLAAAQREAGQAGASLAKANAKNEFLSGALMISVLPSYVFAQPCYRSSPNESRTTGHAWTRA